MGANSSLSIVILAGGRSRRMGRDKKQIILPDGNSFLSKSLKLASSITPNIIVSSGLAGIKRKAFCLISNLEYIEIPDNVPGIGPIAGIESALLSGISDRYLFMACDQPYLSAQVLYSLAEVCDYATACYRLSEGNLASLPCLISASLYPVVIKQIHLRKYSIKNFLSKVKTFELPVTQGDEEKLLSVNTCEELRIYLSQFS